MEPISAPDEGDSLSTGLGVDEPFVEGIVTPFISPAARIFQKAEEEAFPRESRGGTLLRGPDTRGLGAENGRLDRVYATYTASPSTENLNRLLVEVELYARRITLGRGGSFAQYVSQAATHYYSTEISASTTIKVWCNLKQFHGRSKFSVWVFRIARNVLKDQCREIINRRGADLLEWKDYDNEGSNCYRGAAGESADSNFDVSGGNRVPLPTGLAPDERLVKLDSLLPSLSGQDQKIVYLVQEGYKPAEIGEEFRKNAKWASNNLNRIKKALKKLAEERYPEAKKKDSSVLVMKGKTLQTKPRNSKRVKSSCAIRVLAA